MMNDDELRAIEERAAQATPGPWTKCEHRVTVCVRSAPCHEDKSSDEICWDVTSDDAAFIAAAREDVPRLCAEVRRLQGELGKAVELLESVVCGPTPRLVDTDAIREFLAAYHAARRGE